jgi:hypothetical protein
MKYTATIRVSLLMDVAIQADTFADAVRQAKNVILSDSGLVIQPPRGETQWAAFDTDPIKVLDIAAEGDHVQWPLEPNPYTLCPKCQASHHTDEPHTCKEGRTQ